MKASLKSKALRPMINAALRIAHEASPLERADIFEGIALTLRGIDRSASKEAAQAAEAIREAEQRQLLLFHSFAEIASEA